MTPVSQRPIKKEDSRLPEIINPEVDTIVSQYCGRSLSAVLKSDESLLETRALWNEQDTGITFFEKAIVEMLHLAYMKGGEY